MATTLRSFKPHPRRQRQNEIRLRHLNPPPAGGHATPEFFSFDAAGAEVEYLSTAEKAQYEISVINEKRVNSANALIDSGSSVNGAAMLVMDPQVKIYVGTHYRDNRDAH